MSYINEKYGRTEKFIAFNVSYYNREEAPKTYKNGAAADRYARKCAANGRFCALNGLAITEDGSEWVEIAAC